MSVIKVNGDNFDLEVLKSDKPVIVDFSAAWCGPCHMMKPIFEKLSDELRQVKFCACDIDENPKLAQKYGVIYVPTLLVFKGGEMTKTNVGLVGEDQIKKLID